MRLRYDFDIFDIIPSDVFADEEIAKMLGNLGLRQDMVGNKIALFRDQATIDAILAGPPALKAYFKACGFGFTTYESGTPDGRYLAKDAAMQNHTLQQLTENIKDFDFGPTEPGGSFQGGFNFGHFMSHLIRAEPVGASKRRKLARGGKIRIRPSLVVVILVSVIGYALIS